MRLAVCGLVFPATAFAADVTGKWTGDVAGDQLTTTLEFNGNSIKLLYKGPVAGEQIRMTREREGSGQAREFTIKRSKP